jgi:hypothetical protein
MSSDCGEPREEVGVWERLRWKRVRVREVQCGWCGAWFEAREKKADTAGRHRIMA